METEVQTVRPEYKRAANKFVELIRVLGKNPSNDLVEQVNLFCSAVECVDRNHDLINNSGLRADFRRKVESVLRGNEAELPEEVTRFLSELRGLLESLGKTEEFVDCVNKIFNKGELLREIEDTNKAIVLILEEGSLTADLMMIAINNQDGDFAAFMRAAGEIGKLFDDVIDLEGDLKVGERKLSNTKEFYLKSIPLVFYKVLKAMIEFPQFLKPIFVLKMFKAMPRYARRS